MRNLAFTSQLKASLPPSTDRSVRKSYCLGRHEELLVIEQKLQKQDGEQTINSIITSKLNLFDFGLDGNWEQTLGSGIDVELSDCPSSWITQVQFIPDTECMYFSTESGKFSMLDRSNLQEVRFRSIIKLGGKLTELFHSEEGIASFCVSPDGRFVAAVTNIRSLLLMSIPYVECIAHHIHPHSHLLLKSQQECDSESDNSVSTDRDVSIAWRSDSKYFAVNTISETNKRCISVYDESGSLVSRTDETISSISLLNSSLTWQPSGGLIAAFGYSPTSKNSVLLFEKNGLQRAEFSVVSNETTEKDKDDIRGLEWNADSTILAIVYDTRVDLWTRSNYVWMLKRTVKCSPPVTGDACSIIYAKWDYRLGSKLHIVYDNESNKAENCSYYRYDVDFRYTTKTNGAAFTFWWNGRSLFYTPFRDFCAPPPNGYSKLILESNVCSVIISSDNETDSACVIDTLSNFSIYHYSSEKRELSVGSVLKSVGFSIDPTAEWLWLSPCIFLSVTPGSSSVSFYSLNSTQLTVTHVGDVNVKSFIGDATLNNLKQVPTIRRIFHVPDTSSFLICELFQESLLILVELSSILENIQKLGKVDTGMSTNVTLLCSLPQNFTSLELIRTSDQLTNNPTFVIVAYDAPTKNLYIQWNRDSNFYSNNSGIKLSFDCTSFCIFDNHLLFTTTGSLQILKAQRLLSILEKNTNENNDGVDVISVDAEKYLRKIEKGSTIVTCCVNRMLEPSLVLQILPRGNIEVIFPRPLLVESFSKSLRKVEDEHRYSKIMTAIRRHRVDYRVLIDEMKLLASEQTSFSVEIQLKLMINQVQNSHSLVLLVTDLNEEYFECIRMIKDILQTIIVKSEGAERKKNLEEAYLASLAKLGLFEEALNSHLIKEETCNRQFVTERVKFLSYYCDNPDTLFDTAIGTYDLTLASLVADCLGKDPKEFVPILDGFQAVSSEDRRKFKIDERLRRFSKAVRHLINDDLVQVDEVLKYMDRHRLYTDVVEYITTSLTTQDEILEENERKQKKDRLEELLKESKSLYGKYLEEHNRVKEASLMYRQGGHLSKAIDCAVKSGSWESALEMFYCSGDNKDLDVLCHRLILQLEELKNYGAAAVVAEEYLQDPARAVELHIRNRRWISARLCAQKNKTLRDSKCASELILPKLEEFAQEHLQSLESLRVDLQAKKDRLKIAKALKQKKLEEGIGADFDNFSETSSISTTSSIRSGSSGSGCSGRTQRSKNRRKMERKLQSMKEGSAYEDLAITTYLWNTIERVEAEVKRETSDLVESLWAFELTSLARSMGSEMDNLVSDINCILKEVWEVLLIDELLEVKYRVPPPSWTMVWDKLSLHESSSKATSSSKQHS